MEHHFNIEIARVYGIKEAILIHNLHYWIKYNVANNRHFYDGRYWTYNTANAFVEIFPYLTATKIYRVLSNLEEKHIISKGVYNQEKYIRTKWYSFTDEGLQMLFDNGYDIIGFSESFQKCKMQFAKMQNVICKNAKCNNIYNNTDIINTDSKQEEGIIIPSKKIDFQAIVDCWNEYNGKRLGKVTKLTTKRKDAIKRLISEHSITVDQLELFLSTIPYADSWLYNPTREHKDWKPDFDWWIANTKGWFTKLIEGKVHTQNQSIFQRIINGENSQIQYTPMTGIELRWSDQFNCYLFTGQSWNPNPTICDGYKDEDRPDGATIMLNNARGTVKWNKQLKKWDKV